MDQNQDKNPRHACSNQKYSDIIHACCTSKNNQHRRAHPTPRSLHTFHPGKGQAPLISHAVIVGFTIFLVYVVFTTFTSLRDDYQKFVGGLEIKEMCFIVRGAAEKVYTAAEYNVSVNTSLGSVEVRLPDRITDLKYNVRFFNKSALIESPGAEFNESCKIGFAANYNGSTSGGLTRFSYIRLANGTNVIEAVKV